MEDSEGVGRVSSGQALLRDHLQSSEIAGEIRGGLGGVMDRHGIDTSGGEVGSSGRMGDGLPCGLGAVSVRSPCGRLEVTVRPPRRTCPLQPLPCSPGTSDRRAGPPCRTYSLGKSLTWRTARGWGGVSSGQALHRDHLQSSQIDGRIFEGLGGGSGGAPN